MVVVAALGHRLLHVTLCTEAHQVILAVPIEWIGGDLMYVIQLELALRSALGAATTLFYGYFRAKRLRWVLALWAQ
mgnify:CR=1 FL=1